MFWLVCRDRERSRSLRRRGDLGMEDMDDGAGYRVRIKQEQRFEAGGMIDREGKREEQTEDGNAGAQNGE